MLAPPCAAFLYFLFSFCIFWSFFRHYYDDEITGIITIRKQSPLVAFICLSVLNYISA